MNLIDNLKKAIETEDWQIICNIYEDISGKSISKIEAVKTKKTKKKKSVKKKRKTTNTNSNEKTTPIQNERTSVFGNKTFLVTDNIPSDGYDSIEEEREANLKKAKGRVKHKREKQSYTVKCSDCEKQFESQIGGGDCGQYCSSCLKLKVSSRS